MTNCPHVGVCPFQRMQPQGVYATESTRERRTRASRYHQQTDMLFPSPATPDLQPGETLTTRTPMRAQRLESDVAVPVLQALVYGVAAASVSVPVVVALRSPWYLPFVVLATVGGLAVFATSAKARVLLMAVETWTGHDLDGDGAVGVAHPPYEATGKLEGERRSIYARFPITDAASWHAFCQAVHGGRNFSGSEYERHAPGRRADFEKILGKWVSQDRQKALVDPSSIGPRKAPKLTRTGRLMVKLFATTPPVAV